MRSIWMKVSLALVLLSAVPLASAAGFDCAKAKTSVEQKICADPELSQLDSQMAQAFEQARAKAGTQMEALLRDQRNWLGERNAAVTLDIPGTKNAPGTKVAAELYQGRIIFLERVFDAPPPNAPLLVAIVKHLASESPSSSVDEGKALGGDGTVFKLAMEQPYDPSKPMPFDTAPLGVLAYNAGLHVKPSTLIRLDDQRFGGLYSVLGTDACVNIALFSWHGRTVQSVPVPETLAQNCKATRGWLVEFQNHVYALQSDESNVFASDIEVQQWVGNHWTSPIRVLVRYDYRPIQQPYVHCSLADCAELTVLAEKAFDRYVRGRNVDSLSGFVPADIQAKFKEERKLAVENLDAGILPFMEIFGYLNTSVGDYYYGMHDMDAADTFFPVHFGGEWLLGRVGRASSAWHISDDWVLAIWRVDGIYGNTTFVPVLGMVVPAQRGDILLESWLPSKTFVSN